MSNTVQVLLAERALSKLAGLQPHRIRPFVQYWVDGVQVWPLLTQGMYCKRRVPDPMAPERVYLILVDEEQTAREVAVTLFHELIHVQLDVAGIDGEFHDEKAIEATAGILADAFPEITDVFRSIFADACLPV